MDKREKIKKLTVKHFEAMTTRQISIEMGNVVSQQNAAAYLNDGALPHAETLLKIIKSPSSTSKARSWARECLAVVLPDVEMTVSEPEVRAG